LHGRIKNWNANREWLQVGVQAVKLEKERSQAACAVLLATATADKQLQRQTNKGICPRLQGGKPIVGTRKSVAKEETH